jgi:phosphoribosyl-ATP pyrophosphohydrolase/phosphoribosyl-AMP cyclohydrolase
MPEPKFNADGLIPAIVQDDRTGEVLMLAYMNAESLARTRATGQAWFWSRSRQELWHKGATSGNYLNLRSLAFDCDGDVVLLRVLPAGPTCHTGARSCFFTPPEHFQTDAPATATPLVLNALWDVIRERQETRPEGSYTSYLFNEGIDKIGKKIGEEGAETIIAAKNGEPARIASEVADLFYHTLVLLADRGVPPEKVWEELERRKK